MAKGILIFGLIFLTSLSYSQELVTSEYEKGYVKDGNKYSVWEYYDHNKELEIKINYTSGKVYFIKKDTSDYVIFRDGEWTAKKLEVYPIPIKGYHNFYRNLLQKIRYPLEARRAGIEGEVLVMFEVDSLGASKNYTVIKNIGGGCGEEALRLLKEVEIPWIAAQVDGKTYSSRFIIPISFSLGGKLKKTHQILPLAKILHLSLSTSTFSVPRVQMYLNRSLTATRVRQNLYVSLEEALKSRTTAANLSMAGKRMNTLPSDVGKLKELTFLDLERNQLTELPQDIAGLGKLEELYLPMNNLTMLPDEIGSLKQLKVLALAENQFTQFPKIICSCGNLEVLDLGVNKIAEVPPCIAGLKKLRMIILRANSLTTLPPEFFDMTQLETIYLQENPFDSETFKKLNSAFKKAFIFIYR